MRKTNRFGVLMLTVATFSFALGCVTSFQRRTARIPTSSRVGVFVTDADGNMQNTLPQNYLYGALMKAGLVPVAVNDVKVRQVLGKTAAVVTKSDAQGQGQGQGRAQDQIPVGVRLQSFMRIIGSLREHFLDMGLHYLLIVHVDSRALDEDMRAIFIRTKDMQVIGMRYYRRRAMVFMWMFPPGWSVIWTPWTYLIDSESRNQELVHKFVQFMMN